MAERNAANGYMALIKEVTKGTALTPTTYVPYYDQNLITDTHLISDTPIYGNKFKRFQSLQGLRSHHGSATVMAEPNTAARWADMLSTKNSTTGANPYTHTFGTSTTDPNSYTLDVSLVSQVVRFFGVEASKMALGWQNEEMVFQLDLAALGSFWGAEIASIATNVVTLVTTYDPVPTAGLVANDLVKVTKVDGTVTTNYTITSITNTTVTLSATAGAFAAGDMLVLRPATVALTLLTPFLWGKTQFFFAADAATALTNSSTVTNQTRLDPGTQIDIMHDFDSNQGSKRTGDFDPASLMRKQYDLSFKAKKFFDLPEEIKYYNSIVKRACIMRSYSGATNQYEIRVTLNNLSYSALPVPTKSGDIIYEDLGFMPNYDATDTQGFDLKLINAISTI